MEAELGIVTHGSLFSDAEHSHFLLANRDIIIGAEYGLLILHSMGHDIQKVSQTC